MEIIKSNKGGNKICINGYTYIKKYDGCKRLTWRCTKECSLNYRGTLHTNLEKRNLQIRKVHSRIANTNDV